MSSATAPNDSIGLPVRSNDFPRRIKVKEVVRSRYQGRNDDRYTSGKKPLSWDERIAGIDEIITEAGERLSLFSNGGQSTPAPGWELLLTGFAAAKEVSIAPRPAEPLIIQTLSSTPIYGDAAAAAGLHSGPAAASDPSGAKPIIWTLYGIAKT